MKGITGRILLARPEVMLVPKAAHAFELRVYKSVGSCI